MIKNAVRNYFINLKYFFTPLGTFFLGVLMGVSVLFSGIEAEVKYVADSVNEIVENAALDGEALNRYLVSSASALSWEDPLETLAYLRDSDWLDETLSSYVGAATENYAEYADRLTITIRAAAEGLARYFIGFLACMVLGLVGGYFLTKYLIRREIARRNLFKFALVTLIDSLLSATIVAFCTWLLALWKPSIFISSAVSVLLFGSISLFEAYVAQGGGPVAFKEIVNPKNALLLFVSNFLILLISGAIVSAATFLTNTLVGGAAGFSLSIVALSVISLNAEAYVAGERNAVLRPGLLRPEAGGEG